MVMLYVPKSNEPVLIPSVVTVAIKGILIAMHDLTLDATTGIAYDQFNMSYSMIGYMCLFLSFYVDVASHPEFDDRKSTKIVGGNEMSGYFAIDFTYDGELLML
jgi:hypothetical protein